MGMDNYMKPSQEPAGKFAIATSGGYVLLEFPKDANPAKRCFSMIRTDWTNEEVVDKINAAVSAILQSEQAKNCAAICDKCADLETYPLLANGNHQSADGLAEAECLAYPIRARAREEK